MELAIVNSIGKTGKMFKWKIIDYSVQAAFLAVCFGIDGS